METTTTVTAEQLAKLIYELEELLDDTLNKSAELVAHLPVARKAAGLSAVYGQQVFERAGRVVTHLVDARRAVVETHNGCEAVRRQLRINMGPENTTKPPPSAEVQLELIVGDKVA
jgi:hypothetical protein